MQIHPPNRGTFFKQTPPLERGRQSLIKRQMSWWSPHQPLPCGLCSSYVCECVRGKVPVRETHWQGGCVQDDRYWASMTFEMIRSGRSWIEQNMWALPLWLSVLKKTHSDRELENCKAFIIMRYLLTKPMCMCWWTCFLSPVFMSTDIENIVVLSNLLFSLLFSPPLPLLSSPLFPSPFHSSPLYSSSYFPPLYSPLIFGYSNKVITKLPDTSRFIAVFSYYRHRNIQRFRPINHIDARNAEPIVFVPFVPFWD